MNIVLDAEQRHIYTDRMYISSLPLKFLRYPPCMNCISKNQTGFIAQKWHENVPQYVHPEQLEVPSRFAGWWRLCDRTLAVTDELFHGWTIFYPRKLSRSAPRCRIRNRRRRRTTATRFRDDESRAPARNNLGPNTSSPPISINAIK